MSIPLSTINIGATANDGTGDTVRAAFSTVNTNFQSVNTVVSALQSNAVTAATIVSLNMTGNLVAANVTANANVYGNLIGSTVTLSSAMQFANLTTAQVNSITSPTRGMTVYNYTSGNIQVYNGVKWANLTLS